MKKYLSLLVIVLMFCAVTIGGCGGGDNLASVDSGESQTTTDDTDTESDTTGGRGRRFPAPPDPEYSYEEDSIVYLYGITRDYTVQDGQTLTDTLDTLVKISIADGATITLNNAVVCGDSMSDGWAGLTCEGDATIILVGENVVKGFYEDYPGIYVPEGKTLTIKGDGSLSAYSESSGAGIGGGYELSCGNIVIEGGNIFAFSSGLAAGIGGGYRARCGNITIKGGNIRANGGAEAAGIGSGSRGSCGNITINDCTFTATKGNKAADSVGAGYEGKCGTVTIDGITGSIIESPLNYSKPIDISTITTNYTVPDGKLITGTPGANVKISIADGATVTLWHTDINGGNSDSCKWAGLNCEGDAAIILIADNTVRAFHEDYPGIHIPEGKTLTIRGTGSLTASCSSNGLGAGIGGGNKIPCGNIVIESGTITATGRGFSAGIGGGSYGNCGNITITGGTVNAIGNGFGAGIGSGGILGNSIVSTCGNITISGGTVNAEGMSFGAGIGSGSCGKCGNITISGGTVTATCKRTQVFMAAGAGIGSGTYGSCGDITIYSKKSNVTATNASDSSYNMGAGYEGTCGTVTITEKDPNPTAKRKAIRH